MRARRRTFLAATFGAVFFLLAAYPASARILALQDLRREVTLADPQISADGARVALLVGVNNFQRDIVAVHVDIVDVATNVRRSLKLPFDEIASVRWSPDGRHLAFLAAKRDQPHQLYVCSADGGALRKLTQSPQDVEYFAWRPDGRALAFVRSDASPVRSGAAKFNTGFVVGDNDYLASEPPLPSHLWLTAVAPGQARRLTHGPWSLPPSSTELSQPYLDALITPQHMPNNLFCWYPDSRHIAYTQMPDAYISHADAAVMRVFDSSLASNRDLDEKLTNHKDLEAGCDISWDGTKLAYWYPTAQHPINASAIFVTDASARGISGLDVTRNLDRSPWVVRWLPDNLSLLILAHDGTREGMWQIGLDAGVHRLDVGDLNPSGASISRGGAIAFIASGARTPTELYIMQSVRSAARRLTDYNGFFASLHLGAVRRIAWRTDRFDESGVLTYPPDFIAGKKYPLALQIHGWPQYASQEAFDTDYPGLSQLLAAHGYLVFEPNYRGSDSDGNAFETAILGDTVAGPARDILTGIAAVRKLGIVDESKIAVSGWSYGGLLTAWLIGHDHRWKAAIAGAAPTDLAADYAISSYNVLDRFFYGNALWASRSSHTLYSDQSPITFAWNIVTPTLIMGSVYDTTVPVMHSYELFHALRDRGVPVQFVAYPSSDHFPSDPVSAEDIYRRWVGWLDRYLR